MNGRSSQPAAPRLSAKEISVIVALLTRALEVKSLLIDSDQTIQIVLEGSLKKKTEMDRLIDEMSDLTIGDFFDSIMKR
jgi:hypothetical protein